MNFEDDAVETTKEDLDSLAKATKELDRLQNELAGAEALVADIQAKIKHIRMGALPDLLAAAKLPSVTTDGGRVITRKQIVSGTWPKDEDGENAEAVKKAVEWLRQERLEGLIKAQIKIDFDKGDFTEAEGLFNAIRSLPQANKIKALTLKEGVHPQTLNATLRQRMEEGKETPLELFNGYTAWIAEITEPGKKKGKK